MRGWGTGRFRLSSSAKWYKHGGRLLMRSVVAVLLLCLLSVGTFKAASDYLLYADEPHPADLVVVFVGPGREERISTAQQLIRDGYSDRLFIPAHQGALFRRSDSTIEDLSACFVDGLSSAIRPEQGGFPGYYENTHIYNISKYTS